MRRTGDDRLWEFVLGGTDGKLIAVGHFVVNAGPRLTLLGGDGTDAEYLGQLFDARLEELALGVIVSPIPGLDVPFDRLNPLHAGVAFDAVDGVKLLTGGRVRYTFVDARPLTPDDPDDAIGLPTEVY